MTPAQQGLVLGIAPACGAPDLEQAGRTYQAFLQSTGEWRPSGAPVPPARRSTRSLSSTPSTSLRDGRPRGTAVEAVLGAGVRRRRGSERGSPAAPSTRWRTTATSIPSTLDQVTALSDLAGRRARLEQLRFVQRVFPDPPAAALPDVLVTARASPGSRPSCWRSSGSACATPRFYRAAARRATAIDAIGDGSRRYASLAQFQGAFAVLDGAAGARYLDRDRRLAGWRRLSWRCRSRRRGYEGGIAGWLATCVMPALRAPMAESIGDPGGRAAAPAGVVGTAARRAVARGRVGRTGLRRRSDRRRARPSRGAAQPPGRHRRRASPRACGRPRRTSPRRPRRRPRAQAVDGSAAVRRRRCRRSRRTPRCPEGRLARPTTWRACRPSSSRASAQEGPARTCRGRSLPVWQHVDRCLAQALAVARLHAAPRRP